VKTTVLLVLSVALLAGAAVASTRGARVSVESLSPAVVRGAGFKARERVAVTLSAKTTRTKAVTATAAGTFRVAFRAVTLGRCDFFAVRARGTRGRTAFLRVTPECAPSGATGDFDPGLPIDPNPKKH
jgi:hypothetical protein